MTENPITKAFEEAGEDRFFYLMEFLKESGITLYGVPLAPEKLRRMAQAYSYHYGRRIEELK